MVQILGSIEELKPVISDRYSEIGDFIPYG